MMNEDDLPLVAFPQTVGNAHCFGMMLRDYFAAAALQGMLASPDDNYETEHERRTDYNSYAKCFAESAYIFADKMLEARK
jgi:hypothetical protein